MFKLLVLLVGAIAGGVSVTTAALVVGHASASSTPPTAAAQEITMQVLNDDDRMIGPNLVVHSGPIVLTVVNHARHAHLFSVPELGIEHVILPGSSTNPTITTIRFTAPLGVFHWFCKLPCNRTMSGDIYAVAKPPNMHGPLWATA